MLCVLAAAVAAAGFAFVTSGSAASRTTPTVAPADGPSSGGTLVTIVGTGLSSTTAVHFGHRAARFTVIDNNELHTVAPPGAGTLGVRVTTSASPPPMLAGRFTYLVAPTVRSVVPDVANAGGGPVVIRGTGFATGTRVLVGARYARGVVVRNPDAIDAVVPAGFGSFALRVVTPAGTSRATVRSRFAYRADVLVVGDSLGIDLGWGFTDPLRDGWRLRVTDDAVGSSGLVRPDFYSWPAHLRADLRVVRPTVVIALFGANDDQPIETARGLVPLGTRAWALAYEARIRQLAAIVTSTGATFAWVGLPRMGPRADVPGEFVLTEDRVGRAALRSVPGGCFVRTASLFTTGRGTYTPYVRLGPHDVQNGRQPDGVHLTPSGAIAIDTLVLDTLVRFDARAR